MRDSKNSQETEKTQLDAGLSTNYIIIGGDKK